MKKVISSEKLPIKLWLEDIEGGALEQVKNLANLPFAYKWISIMPDSHQGYGMPIGGVLATKGVIIPNAVGVDIGCGMCAIKTSLINIDIPTLKIIMGEIRKQIPVGFNKHEEKQDFYLMPLLEKVESEDEAQDELFCQYEIVSKEFQNALHSLGTLGGGNHFIEIQKGSDGYIWVMIHSGSRNLGKQIADHYNKLAIKLNEKWFSEVPKKWELAFLPIYSDEGQLYLKEMQYAIDFAFANRKLMINRIKAIFRDFCPAITFSAIENGKDMHNGMINIAHNYARMENHFGENVLIHRKGATLATQNTIGIIPGSQGTKSYIVKGKGNPESFMSCSHGAGRKMSRSLAEKELNLEEEIKKLDDKGILHTIRGVKDLDEAIGAYKPIEVVMANQEDLIEILVELEPLAVIKG